MIKIWWPSTAPPRSYTHRHGTAEMLMGWVPLLTCYFLEGVLKTPCSISSHRWGILLPLLLPLLSRGLFLWCIFSILDINYQTAINRRMLHAFMLLSYPSYIPSFLFSFLCFLLWLLCNMFSFLLLSLYTPKRERLICLVDGTEQSNRNLSVALFSLNKTRSITWAHKTYPLKYSPYPLSLSSPLIYHHSNAETSRSIRAWLESNH